MAKTKAFLEQQVLDLQEQLIRQEKELYYLKLEKSSTDRRLNETIRALNDMSGLFDEIHNLKVYAVVFGDEEDPDSIIWGFFDRTTKQELARDSNIKRGYEKAIAARDTIENKERFDDHPFRENNGAIII